MADRYVVGGIAFSDSSEAERAVGEAKRIEALDTRIDYNNPRTVISLYQKAQSNHVFRTPVGVSYMLKLQGYLREHGVPEEQIPPVDLTVNSAPVPAGFAADEEREPDDGEITGKREKVFEARIRSQKNTINRQLNMIKMQWAVIGVLGLIIIAMFIITLTGNNPTIINYRSKILNQYSEWEQELTERENALSIKEQAAGAALR